LGNSDQISLDENDVKRRPLEPDYDVSSRGGEHATDALHTGSWDWHSCVLNGKRNETFNVHCPKTASVVTDLEKEGLLFGTPFGFAFFSTLHGKSYIKAHTGPMNLRLRIHLPLVVPQDTASATVSQGRSRPLVGIRVADQVRQWTEGSALVLDDSYVHEAWNDANDSRVVFLCDIWHPDIRFEERRRIMNMFDYAKGKGWIGGNSSPSSSSDMKDK
jgi:aspartate beta-hydroxylase